jgi:ribonuclease Z
MVRMTSGRSLGQALLIVLLCSCISRAQTKAVGKTQIVLLGTGTPLPDPERNGPSRAIIVNGTPYLVDFGTGLARRAAQRATKM